MTAYRKVLDGETRRAGGFLRSIGIRPAPTAAPPTMASQYVIAGGSLETLQRILGHSTVLVTERCAHLRPGHFSIADRNRLAAEFHSDAHAAKLAAKFAAETLPRPSERQHNIAQSLLFAGVAKR